MQFLTHSPALLMLLSDPFSCSTDASLSDGLSVNINYVMKAWTSGYIAPPLLISALSRGMWSASRRCRFSPEEGTSCTHWRGGWLCPGVSVSAVEKRISFHCGNRRRASSP
jgi:hypothetical protein